MRINPFKHTDRAGKPAAPRMARRKPRTAALIAGVALVSAAALAGGTTVAVASTSASPAATQTLHFQIMSTSPTANTAPVIAWGAFTAGGVDIMGDTSDTLRFPGGSFRVFHSQGKGSRTFNPATCLMTLDLRGTYTVSHGTGRFAGISGHGTYHLSIIGIAGRSHGACNQNAQPVAFQQTIDASGPVHL